MPQWEERSADGGTQARSYDSNIGNQLKEGIKNGLL